MVPDDTIIYNLPFPLVVSQLGESTIWHCLLGIHCVPGLVPGTGDGEEDDVPTATLQAPLLEDADYETNGEGGAGHAAGSPLKNMPRNIFG